MTETSLARSDTTPVPHTRSLTILRKAANHCRACDLYRAATQTVFGEGPSHAQVVVVGEQPGDVEDREGHPFVGPAGKILDRALHEAGIPKSQLYLTNAVKHFKFEERGKRRIHKKPDNKEIDACRPWLEAEIAAVRPSLLVALGVTAAQSLLSKKVTIRDHRAKFIDHPWAKSLFITVHPSAILRVLPQDREKEYNAFLNDWRAIAQWLRREAPG